MEEQIERDMKSGFLSKEVLEHARLEQIVIGPHANFNFFYSPLWAKEDWGDTEKAFEKLYNVSVDVARNCLANQFISIDERRETIWDGIRRLPVDIQQKLRNKEKTGERAPPTFEVTLHGLISVRESLIKDMLWCANNLLLEFLKHEPYGCLPWCLQTLVTWDKTSKFNYKPGIKTEFTLGDEPKTGEDYGIYDAGKSKNPEMHLFVTQDIAVRHGGGANVHMGIGGQYSNAVLGRTTSLGDRYAMEIRNALEDKRLSEIVT
jgi:5-formaminoimidazole-4-carboxamide-1-beta-D-ribofuranosyl 5'-monophosphate synthetase